MSERVFKSVNDFVYELVVGGVVPTDPVTHVAAEAAAVEERRVIAGDGDLPIPAGVARRGG